MAENKISNSRVGTDCCQHFWPASGYVYTAASHSQYPWDCNILEQLHPPVRFQVGILAAGEQSWGQALPESNSPATQEVVVQQSH